MNAIRELLLDSPTRHVVQNALMGIPVVRSSARRFHHTGLGRDPDKIAPVLGELLSMTLEAGGKLQGQVLLELGPGQTPDLLFAALLYGVRRAVGVDVVPYLSESVRRVWTYTATREWIAARLATGQLPSDSGLRLSRYEGQASISEDDLKLSLYDGQTIPLPDNSVDIIWSKSVLEHVRFPTELINEMCRVLRPEGVMCHIIDLRDHYTFGKDMDWLRFLRYSNKLWESMTSRRSAWTNRLRAPQWDEIFAAAGVVPVAKRLERAELHPQFSRKRLATKFRTFTDEELCVAWYRAVHRAP
jgi:SAM-dependent methyltransferase